VACLRVAPGDFLERIVERLARMVWVFSPAQGGVARRVADHLADLGEGGRQEIELAPAFLERRQHGQLGAPREEITAHRGDHPRRPASRERS
jgi:hypothetical protein